MISSRNSLKNHPDLLVTTRSQQSLQGKFRPRSGLFCPVNWPSMLFLRVPRLSLSLLVLRFENYFVVVYWCLVS
uniref:Uncharacterized protein n=1 Tax=Medicago truncatula TaxID=3880 RepID=I3SL45_MEDTR|nr:unknown [Medicago truncatula]